MTGLSLLVPDSIRQSGAAATYRWCKENEVNPRYGLWELVSEPERRSCVEFQIWCSAKWREYRDLVVKSCHPNGKCPSMECRCIRDSADHEKFDAWLTEKVREENERCM